MNKLIVYVVIETRRLENNDGGDTGVGCNRAVGESMGSEGGREMEDREVGPISQMQRRDGKFN